MRCDMRYFPHKALGALSPRRAHDPPLWSSLLQQVTDRTGHVRTIQPYRSTSHNSTTPTAKTHFRTFTPPPSSPPPLPRTYCNHTQALLARVLCSFLPTTISLFLSRFPLSLPLCPLPILSRARMPSHLRPLLSQLNNMPNPRQYDYPQISVSCFLPARYVSPRARACLLSQQLPPRHSPTHKDCQPHETRDRHHYTPLLFEGFRRLLSEGFCRRPLTAAGAD